MKLFCISTQLFKLHFLLYIANKYADEKLKFYKHQSSSLYQHQALLRVLVFTHFTSENH